ncbi:hypothetical protein O3P69_020011 [Scylla paramamosain]|uniref:Uncharacterized protein n=1 Tax=Scylla paramamosain TaxID=85552 RepID=A0AAW0TN58_SCYPA
MFQSWKYGGAHFEAETTTGYGNFTHQLISQMDMVDRARQVLGRLRTREAFMWPVNFPILPHMVKEYDFSFFLERSTLAFTMAKPSIKPSWQSLYYPLQIDVWIYILVTTLIVLIVLIVMNRSSKDDGTSAWLVMKQVLGTLLDEAIPGELPLKDSTRVALTAWLIFSFIGGLIDKWKDMVMDVVRREGRQRRRLLGNVDDEDSANVKIKPLSMVHMQGPFLLYVLCAIVSTAAFLGEVTQGPFLRKKRYGSE